ncbi:transporter substrate-binding domain-containing protein [Arcobacter sp. L]|uniref:transporter substrate-binding domain-containing protein n=1 Tax=Arcobacter sp. L TaxID=944547 RepID=UPI0002295D9B|nr:transporter substrate-binding domain-containing protein [Arcobacter sp. L]BAK72172.1 two-component sensor kinase [Arcobacter sp. L]
MKILVIIFLLFLNIYSKDVDFKISYDPNYAPFSYNQDGKEAGLYIDIWKLWAKYNNYTIEFVDGNLWENAINLVKEGKVDFFIGTNSFEDWMVSSDFFYETKSTFFTLTKNNFLIEMKEHLKIGLIGNDYKDIILNKFPDSNIIIYNDYVESINALRNNQIDLIYDDKLAIEYFSVQNNLFHLIKPLDNLITKVKTQAITTNKEKAEIFNKGFIKIPTIELLNLEKKWILNENEQYYQNFKQPLKLTDEELNFIKNNIIKVSISNSWEPFTFKSKNSDPIGISSEYWKLILNKLNLKTKNEFYETFSQQLNSIKDKKSDLIFSVGETPQRKEYATFSKEYASFPISIVTKKDENFIENISIIKNKKIAIGNNFTAHNILKNKFPNMNFILVNSIKEGLTLVSKGKAYAFIDIQPVLFYNIAKYNFDNLKISGNTGLNFSLKFMIRDDYPILESILNKAISSISINELNSIINKWHNVQFQTSFNYDIFWKMVLVILLISLAFIYRNLTLKNINRTLKTKVEEKTKQLNEINKNLELLVEKKSRELIQKENILNHQSKMAAMGEMIENIAHQWRQPLSVISTVATAAKLKKDLKMLDDKEFYETMDIINNSSQHLSNTIDDFRNFFSNDKEVSSFNINTPIDKVIYLINSKLKNRNIQVIKSSLEINILGLENEFIQVILNIINNSIDAFEDKNDIEKYIFINIYKENSNVILTIKDNAGGIKEEIIDRIFEPYFTTKHRSQGTGIGLYMSIEIIKKHMNGEIFVSNKEYIYNNIKCKGAEFKIKLPINE